MPEYLAPGVYIEETSFRQKPIEGVSTSTTGFVGPTRDGPIYGEPPLLTSFQEYSEVYGGIDPLEYGGNPFTNFVAHAVRAFFEEGGKRLYIARVFAVLGNDAPARQIGPDWSDGRARWSLDDDDSIPGSPPPGRLAIRARHPGAAGNRFVTFRFRLGANILDTNQNPALLNGASRFDVVWVQTRAEATANQAGEMYWVDPTFDAQGRREYHLRRDNPSATTLAVDTILDLQTLERVMPVSVSVTVEGRGRFRGRFDVAKTYEELAFHPTALAPGGRQSVAEVFAEHPNRRATDLFVPIVLTTQLSNGVDLAEAVAQRGNLEGNGNILDALGRLVLGGNVSEPFLSTRIELRGGNDGERPDGEYQGQEDPAGTGEKSGLLGLEDLEDISIMATPGSTFLGGTTFRQASHAITGFLLSHCERMRYRVAVLDSNDGALPGEVRDQRSQIDSKHGALYYPWVKAFDPISEAEIELPPSGFLTGIYARNDVERGVHKAPANEVIRLAIGLEILINKGQQEGLNPLGINCIRFFEGRGFRVWGARSTSSDGEWKYINLRRNFAYLGRSIELGTQFAVFEPNGDDLWANVRRSVEDFLFNEWKNRRLMGVTPDEAFFVRCDRTTMTQSDIDNGRMVCLIGVALLRPAEFVIFRIGQKTLDFKG